MISNCSFDLAPEEIHPRFLSKSLAGLEAEAIIPTTNGSSVRSSPSASPGEPGWLTEENLSLRPCKMAPDVTQLSPMMLPFPTYLQVS